MGMLVRMCKTFPLWLTILFGVMFVGLAVSLDYVEGPVLWGFAFAAFISFGMVILGVSRI